MSRNFMSIIFSVFDTDGPALKAWIVYKVCITSDRSGLNRTETSS